MRDRGRFRSPGRWGETRSSRQNLWDNATARQSLTLPTDMAEETAGRFGETSLPAKRENPALDQAGFFQRRESAVLIDRLQTTRGHAHPNELLQLRHPDTVLMEIRAKNAGNVLGHVTANAAFFLGHTAAVNNAATRGPGSGNAANF